MTAMNSKPSRVPIRVPSLTFAVETTVAGLDVDVVGWILLLAGVAGLVLFFYFNRRRTSRTVVTERRGYQDTGQPPA